MPPAPMMFVSIVVQFAQAAWGGHRSSHSQKLSVEKIELLEATLLPSLILGKLRTRRWEYR